MTPEELRTRTKHFAIDAVCRARSDQEFVAKLGVVIEESDESAYWLEILVDARITKPSATARLRQEAEELTRIFVSSRITVRRRLQRKRNGATQR